MIITSTRWAEICLHKQALLSQELNILQKDFATVASSYAMWMALLKKRHSNLIINLSLSLIISASQVMICFCIIIQFKYKWMVCADF